MAYLHRLDKTFLMDHKTCIVIVGPTASGKTKLSLELAEHFNTEIISADSRQCYRELEIGVAKPDKKELKQVKHHFINSHSIHEEVNAAVFESYALDAVHAVFEKNDYAIVVGGTGLYIKAFCEGMDEIPPIDEMMRLLVRKEYEQKGMDWLDSAVKSEDPVFYSRGEIYNPHRMLRALEVKRSTGLSIVDLHAAIKKERPFSIIKAGISIPREKMYEQINDRVDDMIRTGLVDEARALYPFKSLPALQTVGYQEIFQYMDGEITLEQAVEEIKKNTRRYAKRQMTWFRKDPEIHWVEKGQHDLFSQVVRVVNGEW
jgi:tRNA dimethylallyltransferase